MKCVFKNGVFIGEFLGVVEKTGSNMHGYYKYRLVKIKTPQKVTHLRDITDTETYPGWEIRDCLPSADLSVTG